MKEVSKSMILILDYFLTQFIYKLLHIFFFKIYVNKK